MPANPTFAQIVSALNTISQKYIIFSSNYKVFNLSITPASYIKEIVDFPFGKLVFINNNGTFSYTAKNQQETTITGNLTVSSNSSNIVTLSFNSDQFNNSIYPFQNFDFNLVFKDVNSAASYNLTFVREKDLNNIYYLYKNQTDSNGKIISLVKINYLTKTVTKVHDFTKEATYTNHNPYYYHSSFLDKLIYALYLSSSSSNGSFYEYNLNTNTYTFMLDMFGSNVYVKNPKTYILNKDKLLYKFSAEQSALDTYCFNASLKTITKLNKQSLNIESIYYPNVQNRYISCNYYHLDDNNVRFFYNNGNSSRIIKNLNFDTYTINDRKTIDVSTDSISIDSGNYFLPVKKKDSNFSFCPYAILNKNTKIVTQTTSFYCIFLYDNDNDKFLDFYTRTGLTSTTNSNNSPIYLLNNNTNLIFFSFTFNKTNQTANIQYKIIPIEDLR